MTKPYVLSKRPSAVCLMDPDAGTFKVFATLIGRSCGDPGTTWIALSRSEQTEAEVWKDAAEWLERRRGDT